MTTLSGLLVPFSLACTQPEQSTNLGTIAPGHLRQPQNDADTTDPSASRSWDST